MRGIRWDNSRRCEAGVDPEREIPEGHARKSVPALGPRGLFREGLARRPVASATLNCRQAPAAITRKGYDALPARCVRMRFRFGPEHNNMFVIYSLDVTLAGNS